MRKTQLWFIIILLLIVIGGGVWVAVSGESDDDEENLNTNTTSYATNSSTMNTNVSGEAGSGSAGNTTNIADNSQIEKLAEGPVATMETSFGTIRIKFYTADAPELTKNFIELAKTGYYDGLTFHRIVPGFVIQGGDPLGTGTGGHSYKGEGVGLADEPGALALKHLKGAVAWAKSSQPNSIGSQFYIALDELTMLDGGYSVFGQVIEGMDAVEKIAAVSTDASDRPKEAVKITSVTISE